MLLLFVIRVGLFFCYKPERRFKVLAVLAAFFFFFSEDSQHKHLGRKSCLVARLIVVCELKEAIDHSHVRCMPHAH